MANKYKKALKILKSNSIDEKIKNLEESLPLNHTKGIYSLNPAGFRLGEKDPAKVYYPDVDGNWPAGIPGTPGELEYTRPAGYWGGGTDWERQVSTDFSQDYLETDPTGRSTDKLIGEDGTVFSELPPGGESFILGPVVDGFVPNHTYDAYTNIGYLQKDTRQFVLLARIQGQWKSGLNGSYSVWDGTSTGFTSYNQNFTLEMAQWVRDKILADAYVSKVPYFYSGGVPQVPQSPADCPNCPPGMYGGNGVGPRQFGSGGNPNIGTEQDPDKRGDAKDAGYPWGKDKDKDKKKKDDKEDFDMQKYLDSLPPGVKDDLLNGAVPFDPFIDGLIASLTKAGKIIQTAGQLGRAANNWFNKGRNERIPDERNASWRDLARDDAAQRGQSDAGFARGDKPPLFGRPDQAFNPWRPGSKGGPGSGPTPLGRRVGELVPKPAISATSSGSGNKNSGNKSKGGRRGAAVNNSYEPEGKVLSESHKKILREIKKPYKLPEIPKQKYKMNFSGKYSAQNTPDKTASKLSDDLVASGNARGQKWRTQDKYWQGYETTERMNVIYDRVGHGDQYWDEVVKENQRKTSWKNKEMQEHLNIIAHEKAMREDNPNYESPFYTQFIEEQETAQVDNDPLFKKVSKRLKKQIDYLDKPSKNGVPNEAPPEMVNGYHPEFGKRKSYYNKLDPQSAAAMPETGDPEIDSQVKAARKKPK